MAGQSKDYRPTRNWTGGSVCPARDRGSRIKPLGTTQFPQPARNHAQSQLKTIIREQRPSGESSRVPASESRQQGASQQNCRSGGRRGRPKLRSTREGDRSEITIFQRCRLYRTGLSGDSAIPESRATRATTSLITRDCNRLVEEVRGLPTVEKCLARAAKHSAEKGERLTVKPLDKDCQ